MTHIMKIDEMLQMPAKNVEDFFKKNLKEDMTASQAQAVVPYGKSHSTRSMLLSGMPFISSRQSPCKSSMFVSSIIAILNRE